MTLPDTELQRIAGSPAERYLKRRGVWCDLAAETHALAFGREPWGGRALPCLYSRLRDTRTGTAKSYQRTLLDCDGRMLRGWQGDRGAKVPKLSAAGLDGSNVAVMIDPPEHVTHGLTIVEGVEAALAIARHWRWRPVWALPGTGAMQTFEPPADLECLTIFADADEPGLLAAETCRNRMEMRGIETLVIASPVMGEDADELALRLESECQ